MKKRASQIIRAIAQALLCVHAVLLTYYPARAAHWLIERGVEGVFRYYSFRNSSESPLRDGFAIAYHNVEGLTLALTQVALAQSALVMYFAGRPARRRIAWWALIALSALWFGNALYFSIVGGFEWYAVPLAIHTLGLAGTLLAVPRRER